MLIEAMAIVSGYPLITKKDFKRISGLEVLSTHRNLK